MEEGADLLAAGGGVRWRDLPGPVYEQWMAKTGKPMLDGIGATEMLHIFISNRFENSQPACTGTPVRVTRPWIVDGEMNEVPRGRSDGWRCAGPTGCRYLSIRSSSRNMSATAGT
jgi:2-aminobenzoate-CoA ligase